MDAKEALAKAGEKSEKSLAKRQSKDRSRPIATVSSVISCFQRACDTYGYAGQVLLNQQEQMMVAGFIKWATRNDKDAAWVFNFLEKCVARWSVLKKKPVRTDKSNKEIVLHDRPNLRDIMVCRLDFLTLTADDGDMSIETPAAAPIQPHTTPRVERKRRQTRAEEFDQEMMEDYLGDRD